MPTDYEAKDLMFGVVNENVVTAGPSFFGYIPQIVWRDAPADEPPEGTRTWLRVSHNVVTQRLSGFNDTYKIYETSGLLYIQLFYPRAVEGITEIGDMFADFLRDIFRGAPVDGITFRDARVMTLNNEEKWFRQNIVVTFEYDEVRG